MQPSKRLCDTRRYDASDRRLVRHRGRRHPSHRHPVRRLRDHRLPPRPGFCRNPHCSGENQEEHRLPRRGTVWSYTNACYPPPPPFATAEPYTPVTLAAVELAEAGLIVLGQVSGLTVDDLRIGMEVELTHGALADGPLVWMWGPRDERRGARRGHAPMGQTRQTVHRVRRGRRAGGAGRCRNRLERRAVPRRGGHDQERLSGLRGRFHLRAGAGLVGDADRLLLRRLRVGSPGRRPGQDQDPGRAVRRRARRGRRRHAQGVLQTRRRRPARRSGLAAVPAAGSHQSRLLRALRPQAA